MGITCSCLANKSILEEMKDEFDCSPSHKQTENKEEGNESSKRQDTKLELEIDVNTPAILNNSPTKKLLECIESQLNIVNQSPIKVTLITERDFNDIINQNNCLCSVLSKVEPQLRTINFENNNDLKKINPVAINRPNEEEKDYYYGYWNAKGQASGMGTLITKEGSLYKGLFNEGVFDGKGLLINPRGDYYLGEWRNGECEEEGLVSCNGYAYIGNFKDNMKFGKGKETFANGTIYEGEFLRNEREGQGKITYPDGSSYEGHFENSFFDGKGVYLWPNNRRYKGEFKNGLMNGEGKHQWNDGSIYIGNYVNNKKVGNGKYIWRQGTELKGNWKNNEPQGKCSYLNNGIDYLVTFRFGKIISAKPLNQNDVDMNQNYNKIELNHEGLLNQQEGIKQNRLDLLKNNEILSALTDYKCDKCNDLVDNPYKCEKCSKNYCFNCILNSNDNTSFHKCLPPCNCDNYSSNLNLKLKLDALRFECKCSEVMSYDIFVNHKHLLFDIIKS